MSPNIRVYSRVPIAESSDTLTALEEAAEPCLKPDEPTHLSEKDHFRAHKIPNLRHWLHVLATTILYLLAAYALLRMFADLQKYLSSVQGLSPPEKASARDACACGDSIAEAIALGCKYDELEAAWLPDQCRDDELSREFSRLGPNLDGTWTYWADSNHTQELAIHEVSQHGGSPVYITWEWHALHCLYSWRKSYRSRISGILSDPVHDTEEHSIHCGKILMDRSFAPAALLIS